MTSVITPVDDGFAEAVDSSLSNTIPWNASSPSNKRMGDRLRITRISRGISEMELSERLGIDRNDLGRYKSGERRLSANLLLRFAKLLQVRLESFFQD